jgi:hypothetical protein
MTPLDIAIELSDLFEATGYEGSEIAEMFDTEILPMLRTPLNETDIIGLGDRFSKAIDRVKSALSTQGRDKIRTLKDMMKSAVLTYIQRTHDAMTGREIYHRAIMSGGDQMLTVTGAAILANALASHHSDQAMALMKGIVKKLSGPQMVPENASAAAVSAGAIATIPMNKKKGKIIRRDSIFAENLSFNDLEGNPDTITMLSEIINTTETLVIEGVVVDPTTAELVLAVHDSLPEDQRRRYAAKPVSEMAGIAYRAVQRGIISVVME